VRLLTRGGQLLAAPILLLAPPELCAQYGHVPAAMDETMSDIARWLLPDLIFDRVAKRALGV
jgi:hypothetical protein